MRAWYTLGTFTFTVYLIRNVITQVPNIAGLATESGGDRAE